MFHALSLKTRLAVVTTVVLWASAFVGIRAGLETFSPGGLALLRFLIASLCLFIIYLHRPHAPLNWRDLAFMFLNGVIGVGVYHIALNYGELVVPSGIASFIISQSPVITAVFAILFLNEKISLYGFLGMLVCVSGMLLIACGENKEFKFYTGVTYIFISAIAGAIFSILQKPVLKKYDAIDVTTYTIWSGTLTLLIFSPQLVHDIQHASLASTLSVIYLGIFPGGIAYMTWSYVLSAMPASRAVSFLYFMPVIATLLGWAWLGEVPVILSFVGGLVALAGVWIVNHSYKSQKSEAIISLDAAVKEKASS